jgi:hypothetical protein
MSKTAVWMVLGLVALLGAPVSADPLVDQCRGALEPSLPGGCGAVTAAGCCDARGRVLYCRGSDLYCVDCAGQLPACGWVEYGYYDCGTQGAADPLGAHPLACAGACPAECDPDPACRPACRGLCGRCPEGQACDDDGQCLTPACAGRQCGSDANGFSCGVCPVGTLCSEPTWQCLPRPEGCRAKRGPGCGGCGCEACVCAKYPSCCSESWDLFCAAACEQECGTSCEACPAEPACAPNQCGAWCGLECGGCAQGQVCHHSACCTPACDGKQCGPDGCGGACGECGEGLTCQGAQCLACQPACDGKQCGPDGCGGVCGECDPGAACSEAGLCVQAGSCWGQCGGGTEACYCDQTCSQYGDCCPNICAACPGMNPEGCHGGPQAGFKLPGPGGALPVQGMNALPVVLLMLVFALVGCGGSGSGPSPDVSQDVVEAGVDAEPGTDAFAEAEAGAEAEIATDAALEAEAVADAAADAGDDAGSEPAGEAVVDVAEALETGDTTAEETGHPPLNSCDHLPLGPLTLEKVPDAIASEDLAFDGHGFLIGSDMSTIYKSAPGAKKKIFAANVNTRAGMRMTPAGFLAVCDDQLGRVLLFDPSGSLVRVLVQGLDYPNGMVVDRQGWIYVTEHGAGRVLRIHPYSGEYTVLARDMYLPNGIVFNADYTRLYIGTFGGATIWTMTVGPDGQPGRLEVFADLSDTPGELDGMGVDACGNVYVCEYGSTDIWRISPDGKRKVRLIDSDPSYTYLPNLQWGRGPGWDPNSIYVPDGWNVGVWRVNVGVPSAPLAFP